MDIIKDLLRESKEFDNAYNDLKEACRQFNPYIDSLELTNEKIDPAFGVAINHNFDLLVDKDFTKMKIERS